MSGKIRIALVLASAVTALLLFFGQAGNLYSQQGGGVKIGVVDLKQVSERFSKWIRLAEELEKRGKEVDVVLEKMGMEILKLKESLKDFEPGSDEYADVELKMFKKQQDQKRHHDKNLRELKGLAEKLGGELLDNIENAIRQFGREQGFTVIIKKEEAPALGRADWSELRGYVSRKSVMYYDTNIDLTDKIVEILNEKYK